MTDRPADRPLAMVTGANSGVGLETTRRLAGAGWDVVMLCRSEERAAAARAGILEQLGGGGASAPLSEANLPIELCDLSSLDSVRYAAERLGKRVASRFGSEEPPPPAGHRAGSSPDQGSDAASTREPFLALVNNAGLYRAGQEMTEDGFERTLQVNHLGHFLLTNLLEDTLRRPGARVVNVSSGGHRGGRLHKDPLEDIFRGRIAYNGWRAYGDSKQANVLFTRELDRRWGGDGTVCFAVHPGVLATSIWDRNRTFGMFLAKLLKPLMGSPDAGGEAVSRLVMDPEVADESGGYFNKLEAEMPAPNARDAEFAVRVWEVSARAVGL